MTTTAFGHQLDTIYDGVTILKNGSPAPCPLAETTFDVTIEKGFATTRVVRKFHNSESTPIEALMTMPVGFDSVVTSLSAMIDGHILKARSIKKGEARGLYEDALDSGRLSVLHEEILRGVHMLSVGQLGPGKQIEVTVEFTSTLFPAKNGPALRIPTTVGQLYGESPFASVDDLTTSEHIEISASVKVAVDAGHPYLNDVIKLERDQSVVVTLDEAIEIIVHEGVFGSIIGTSGDGRSVRLDLGPVQREKRALDVAILFDRSGSTSASTERAGLTVWGAMLDGLKNALGAIDADGRISLWQFNHTCQFLGSETGPNSRRLTRRIDQPEGGTELGQALVSVLKAGTKDILVITDGQTWETDISDGISSGARISAVLVGKESLDAGIGHICASTGGQLFYTAQHDVVSALSMAFSSLSRSNSAIDGQLENGQPRFARAIRAGVQIEAHWSDAMDIGSSTAAGRFAASLALPLLGKDMFVTWAEQNSLCTHRTSLVLVDAHADSTTDPIQTRKIPLMRNGIVEKIPLPQSFGHERSEFSKLSIQGRNDSGKTTARYVDPHRVENSPSIPEREFDQSVKEIRIPQKYINAPSIDIGKKMSCTHRKTKFPELAFLNFDWKKHESALLSCSFDSLSKTQKRAVRVNAMRWRIMRLAWLCRLPVKLTSLAIIAYDTADADGENFAEIVFKGVPQLTWRQETLSGKMNRQVSYK